MQHKQQETATASPWDRRQTSFWINDQRKADMRRLAEALGGNATPSDVLAHALLLAVADPVPHGVDSQHGDQPTMQAVADMAALMDAHWTRVSETLEKQQASQNAIAHNLKALHGLISEVAGVDESPQSQTGAESGIPIGEWIDGESSRRANPIREHAVARASWKSKSAISKRMVCAIFEVELVAVDGARVAPCAGGGITVRIDLLESDHPIALARFDQPLYFAMYRGPRAGWTIRAHALAHDGNVGALIGAVNC